MSLQPEIVRKETPPLSVYVCYNCHYVEGDPYPARWQDGKIRIILREVTSTLSVCPNCKNQRVEEGFRDEKADQKRLKKKRKRRVERMKQLYS